MTIVWFDQVGVDDIARVGGKGANLGQMTRAGMPVPKGFCVTTEAYQRFIRETKLWPEIEQRLTTQTPDAASRQIRRMIEQAPIPQSIAEAVIATYQSLNSGHAPVAVRSSATAEDLAEASFAGQQETYLGIRGAQSLIHNIRRCWSSLWTERAIDYRNRHGFAHHQVSLAVVVQEMVAADVAGVLFTIDPMDSTCPAIVVNAGYGLGESVVSGHITPDTYRLAKKKRLKLIARTLGAKETRIDMHAEGDTRQISVCEADRQRYCLSKKALRRLGDLAMQIEAHYGTPQDVEWAFAQNQLYLLQTRPVTGMATMGTATQRPLSNMGRAILNDILEHYPEPPYPLDYQAVTDGYQQLIDAIHPYGVDMPPADQIIRIDEEGVSTITPPTPRLNRRFFRLVGCLRQRLNTDPAFWTDHLHPQFSDLLNGLAQIDVARLRNDQLSAFIRIGVDISRRVGRIRFSAFIYPAFVRGALLKFYLLWAKGVAQTRVFDLLGDLPYKTALIDQDLRRLAAEAAKRPAVSDALVTNGMDAVLPALTRTPQASAFLEQMRTFLDQHGARTMKVYLPFSNRSWAENPAILLTTLSAMLRSTKPLPTAGPAQANLGRRIADTLPKLLRRGFGNTLDRFRTGHVARESTLYTIEQAFVQARRGVDQAAERLTASGALTAPDQVVYLTLVELDDALNNPLEVGAIIDRLARRRQARPRSQAAWRGAWEPSPKSRKGHPQPGTLQGLAGSPGSASGKVKIIHGPETFATLQPGDVLVCPFTDPSWTPLFALACAVVADTGGPLSHAAIVAREYGIPAVLGTQQATSFFKDGDQVRVDGGSGRVTRM